MSRENVIDKLERQRILPFDKPTMPPFARESQTSRAAAISIYDEALTIRRKIWDFIHDRGNSGATCDEVERHMGLRHQTASARIYELRKKGFLVTDGRKRLTSSGRFADVHCARETGGAEEET